LCSQRGSHRPADDTTAEGIRHDGEIEEARSGRHIGVSRPKESHLRPLAEPDMSLSAHPAPTTQPTTDTPATSERTHPVDCARAV
jgi:hypothetical protein